MRIGDAIIDTRRSQPHLVDAPKAKPAYLDRLERDLADYEHYQRLAFANARRGWPLRDLIDRREALAEDLGRMGADTSTVHYRRLRAELDAIKEEIARREKEAT